MTAKRRQPNRHGPAPGFWVKFGLAANFLAQLLPIEVALILGLVVLALPVWLFRP